jgi:hypothetical protein
MCCRSSCVVVPCALSLFLRCHSSNIVVPHTTPLMLHLSYNSSHATILTPLLSHYFFHATLHALFLLNYSSHTIVFVLQLLSHCHSFRNTTFLALFFYPATLLMLLFPSYCSFPISTHFKYLLANLCCYSHVVVVLLMLLLLSCYCFVLFG